MYAINNTPVYVASNSTVKLCVTNAFVLPSGTERDVCLGYTGTGQFAAGGTTNTICIANLQQSSTVSWLWQTNYWANLLANGGCGHLSASSGWFPRGSSIANLTAIPDGAGNFVQWSAGVETARRLVNPISVPVNSPTNVTALFSSTQGWLVVNSLYGSPNPGRGTNIVNYGLNTAGVTTDTRGTTQYVCVGWTGSGSVPATGSSTTSTFNVSSSPSTIVWQWATNYLLTTSVSPSGYGSVSNNLGWYRLGATATVTAVQTSNSLFKYWTGNGISLVGVSNNCTLTFVVTNPVSLTANFDTGGPLTVQTLYGTATPPVGANSVNYGTPVTASISSPVVSGSTTQYVSLGWTGGTGSVPAGGNTNTVSFTFSQPSSLNWSKWTTNYLVTTSTSDNPPPWTNLPKTAGSGSVSNNLGWYRYGATATLSAVRSSSNYFIGWTGSGISLEGISTNNPLVFVVTNPVSLTANFDTAGIITVQTLHSTASPPVGTCYTYYNQSLQMSVFSPYVPVSGGTTQYVSRGWTGTGSVPASGNTNAVSFTFSQPSSINWSKWATNYFVSLNVTPSTNNGNVIGSPAGWYPLGAIATVTAVRTSSGLFNCWTGSGIPLAGVSTNNTLTFVVTNAVSLTANFDTSGPLTVQTMYGTPTPGTTTVNYGTPITASISSPVVSGGTTQYVSRGWTGAGSVPASGNTNAVSFTFSQPSSINWSKWATNYLVVITTSNYIANKNLTLVPGGGIIGNNLGWYGQGANATLTAIASNGYMFLCWTNFNGVFLSNRSDPTLSFTVNKPVSLTALFAVDSDANGLPDWWELRYFGAIHNDPNADQDGDGLGNLAEYQLGTDPTSFDTDNDGLTDGHGGPVPCVLYPRGIPDLNHPGYVAGEQDFATCAYTADTDGDGMGDGMAVVLGRAPLASQLLSARLTSINVCVAEHFDTNVLGAGWSAVPSDGATVVLQRGYTSGAYAIGSATGTSMVAWTIGAVGQPIAWEDYRLIPALLDTPPAWRVVGDAGFYFNNAAELMVCNGMEWVPLPEVVVDTNAWNRITVLHDYRGYAGHWAIWLNGTLAATNLLMHDGIPEYPGFRCYGSSTGQTSWLDDVIVTTSINMTNLANGSYGGRLTNPNCVPPQFLPDVQLSGSAGDGFAQFSWTYSQTDAGADLADNVGSVTLFRTNTVGGSLGFRNETSGQNVDNWPNLLNNQSYTFWVNIVSRDLSFTNQSNLLTLTPQTGALPALPDVTSLMGFGDSTTRYISWQFDATLAVNASAIGFLVHREQDGKTRLVAALPVDEQKHYRFLDTAGDSPATYIVSVIDAQNRRSSGAALTLDVVADGQDEEAMGMIRATFVAGNPPLHLSGAAWQGVWAGAFNGASNAMPVGVSTATGSNNQINLVMPARLDDRQFFQAAMPANKVLSVSFGLQVTGANLNNTGVTVLKLKPLNSTNLNDPDAAICPVTIYQDKIFVGDFSGRFYHGGKQHNYTIVWSDDTHLYIDGNEVALTSEANGNDANEIGNAFVRFGAESTATNIVAVWDHFSLLQGVTDFFPMGDSWQDPTVPGAVSGLRVVSTNDNLVTSTWTPCADADLAAYRVSVSGLKGYTAFVLGTSTSSATISLPIPGSYTMCVQAVDTFGNASSIGQSVAFTVAAAATGTVAACNSLVDLVANGFAPTNGVAAVQQGAWVSFTNGAVYRSAPLSGATNAWSLELTFAISPAIVTNGGFARTEMTQADIMQLFSQTSSRLLSVCPSAVFFGSDRLTDGALALGGGEHTIRFINDGLGLHVAVDGRYLKTLSPFPLTRVVLGDLTSARTSKLNMKRLILVTNGTTAANMLTLSGPLSTEAVTELELDESHCSNSSGLSLVWRNPDPRITLIDVLYLPRRLFEAGRMQTNAVMPMQYLQNGQFVTNTSFRQANDGDPGQVILKVVPHNLSGGTGLGSARMFSQDYPRTGGAVSNVTIAASALSFPAFVVPGYRLNTGGDTNLIVTTNAQRVIAKDGFESDSLKVCLTNDWSFESYISLGSFYGTLFEAVPAFGDPITISYDGTSLHLGSLQIGLARSGLHHLRVTFVKTTDTNGNWNSRGVVNLYIDDATIPVSPSNLLVTAGFDASSVLRFGNLSYMYGTDNARYGMRPVSWADVSVATTNWSAPLRMTADNTSVTSVWRYVTYPTLAGVNAPTPQPDPALAMVYLETLSQTNTVLKYGNGSALAACWTLQFMASVASGVNQILVNNSDASVTVTPTSSGWATYRVVHVPEATTLFVNGSLDSTHVSCAPRGTNAGFDVKITQAGGGKMSLKGLTLINGAMDDATGVLAPIHKLFYTEIASTNGAGLAQSGSSKILFADTALSYASANKIWAFNGATDIVTNSANAQVTCIYGPGNYGVTLLNAQMAPLASLSQIPVSARWTPLGDIGSPMNLVWTPGATNLILSWQPPLNQTVDCYQVQLTDQDLGDVPLANNGVVLPVELPLTIALPRPFIGDNLTLSIYAVKMQDNVPVARSSPLVQVVSSYDTHSVTLVHGQRPTLVARGGDRMADLIIDNPPDDLQGYVLWQNDPASTAGADAVPIKFIGKLGPHAADRINAVAAAAVTHPFLTDAQKSLLADIPSHNLLAEPVGQLSMFFYNEEAGAVTVPISCMQNPAQAGASYIFTFDPYDDALPAPSGPVPPPNLGSAETGSNNIPATSVNTVSIQAQPLNQSPAFSGTALRLSTLPDGPVIRQTVANLSANVPAWIQNAMDPDLILIPASWSNTTLYFAGPLASDRSLVAADVSVIGPQGALTLIADFSTYIDFDQADQPQVTEPFYYDAATRCVKLPFAGSFVCGQALRAGANAFQFMAGDADGDYTISVTNLVVNENGAEVTSAQTTVFYVQSGPRIQVQSPCAAYAVQSNVVVNGTYSSLAGIRSVAVLLNGATCTFDTNTASVVNGAFWLMLSTPPANGANILNVVMTDLAGNVSTSAPVRFIAQSAPVTVHAALQTDSTNLWLNANITGLGAANTAPMLTMLTLNGTSIALTNSHLAISGTTALLTNWLVTAHAGNNIFLLTAGLSLGVSGQADFEVTGAADIYLNRIGAQAPVLPALLSVHPPLDTPLYGTDGTYTFNDSHPFRVTYYDRAPGVDSNNVQVLMRTGTTGIWQNVSSNFVFTETMATLKPGKSLAITTNTPQLKLLVYEKGYTNACATFILGYTVLNASQASQPFIQDEDPFLLGCNLSQTVILHGQNFAGVTNVEFRCATNDLFWQTLRILDLQTGLTRTEGDETVTYDTLTVQILAPYACPALFYLNGVRQRQAPVLIVHASSQESIDRFVRSMTDRNGDGRIDARDLDADGDGLPDASEVTLANLSDDRDGDGIPNWLDQYPDVANTAYAPNATAANVLANMSCLGYAGNSDLGHGPIVVIAPVVNYAFPATTTIYGETLDLLGLVPTGTVGVTVQFASGLQPATTGADMVGPACLYTNANDPLVFHAAINLVKPPSGTDTIIITADRGPGNDPITLSFGLIWDIDPPHVQFSYNLSAYTQPILGYRSLYNSLLVDDIPRVQPQYQIEGVITHNAPLDLSSLEFRLDNEDLPASLFDIVSIGTPANPVVTFSLKDSARINIYDRWNGKLLTKFLSLPNLVYGPHTLSVRIADQHKPGKVGLAVQTFKFDHGQKITVLVANMITCSTGVPAPPSEMGSAGTAAYNAVRNRIDAWGMYKVNVDAGGEIEREDFTSWDAGSEYQKMTYGSWALWYSPLESLVNPNSSFDAIGLVAVNIGGLPTYAGGASEQLLLNQPPRTFAVSTTIPDDDEVYFSKTEVSGNLQTITTWKYVVNSSPSPQLSQQLDLTSLFQTTSDSFALGGPLSLGGLINVTCSSAGSFTFLIPDSDNEDAGCQGGGTGYAGYSGLTYGGPAGNGSSAWGTGSGQTPAPVTSVLRTATLSPQNQTVHVGDSTLYHLYIGYGTYGPTNPVEAGCTHAGKAIQIAGDLTQVNSSGTAALTAQFPAIEGSPAAPYIAKDAADHYYYNMSYRYNFKYYVDGIAIGDARAALTTNSARYAFLPVSDPYADMAVDERALLAMHLIPDDPASPVLLYFDLLVRDPLAVNAPDPGVYPPQVWVNGQPVATVQYVDDPTLPGTFMATVWGQAVEFGFNRLDFTVQNAAGSITHASYFVNIGDQDGLQFATPEDLYIVSQGAAMGTMQKPKLYTRNIYGEFPGDPAQLTGSGLVTSTLDLQRAPGRFGRFERPFFIVDNYPMEGAISIPATAPGVPVMVQQPGGIGTWSAPGAAAVKVYAEGVSIITGGSPTHNLIPGEIASSAFTLEAYVDANRVAGGVPYFEVRLYTADGAAIDLGNGINGMNAIPVAAQDAGTIFDTLGRKFTGASPIQIVSSLTNGVRFALVNGQPTIVLHSGEYVEARFAALSTLAGALIKINLDGDCNGNNNYTDDEVIEKVAPGLLVPQTEDVSASWQGNLVKVHLSGIPKGVNAGSITLTATTITGSGQIKVWSANSTPSTATVWIDTTNGLMSHTWSLTPSSTMGNLPEWLYVQGTKRSNNSGDIYLDVQYSGAAGSIHGVDNLLITVVSAAMVPDFNHDRVIDGSDEALIADGNPFRFWINDDDDQEGAALDKSRAPHCPGVSRVKQPSDSQCGPPPEIRPDGSNWNPLDWQTWNVNGMSDFVDYFPVDLDITNMLKLLPPSDWKYYLCQDNANPSLSVVLDTDLKRDTVKDYLTDETWEASHKHDDVYPVSMYGCEIPAYVLEKIQAGTGGVMLFEGMRESDKALHLKVRYKANPTRCYVVSSLPLKLSGVQQMFRCLNLRPICGDNRDVPNLPAGSTVLPGQTVSQLAEPANNPDLPDNNKNVVFVHGYNEDPEKGLGNICETFKRFYWSGSKAKFTGVTWCGDAGYDRLEGPIPHYHWSVTNAFATAPYFAQYLKTLQGEVNVIAFSLGNMLVSSAIQDHEAHPTRYFMLHAAVAKEAYDATEFDPDMIRIDWRTYDDRLYASKWHNLFPASDKRSALMWPGRFSAVTNVTTYNYYSSGEDVLADNNNGWASLSVLAGLLLQNGRYAWSVQELFKGRYPDWFGGSYYGGWGFNQDPDTGYGQVSQDLILPPYSPHWVPIPSGDTTWIANDSLKTKPFFQPNAKWYEIVFLGALDTSDLYSEPNNPNGVGSLFAQKYKNTLLAEMIPALSFATGTHLVSVFGENGANCFDMNILFKNSWPAVRCDLPDWKHGDYKSVAYVYVYMVFDNIANKGQFYQ